jgi:two-component system alkaline phosphatase synthesis response regulator PhoP
MDVSHRRKILVIDDDETILSLLETVLNMHGFDVVSTADGPQGLNLYTHHKPDAVLLDLALPSMSGLEVLRNIIRGDPRARVLVLTGHASEESAEVALRAGAADYLQKPVSPQELVESIELLFVA